MQAILALGRAKGARASTSSSVTDSWAILARSLMFGGSTLFCDALQLDVGNVIALCSCACCPNLVLTKRSLQGTNTLDPRAQNR